MSIISLRLSEDEDKLIRNYAEIRGISISDLLRDVALEKIENDIDISIYNEAMKKHEKDLQDISFDEMIKELDLNE